MRRHATRVLTMEFRAKRVGTESNPDAPVYVKVVETTAPTDAVEVELTLPAGAYTVQAKANHWLRGESGGGLVGVVDIRCANGGEQGDDVLGRGCWCDGLSGALGHGQRESSQQFGGVACGCAPVEHHGSGDGADLLRGGAGGV
jgi:hypothetical protein